MDIMASVHLNGLPKSPSHQSLFLQVFRLPLLVNVIAVRNIQTSEKSFLDASFSLRSVSFQREQAIVSKTAYFWLGVNWIQNNCGDDG
jgi:hypothetical protein